MSDEVKELIKKIKEDWDNVKNAKKGLFSDSKSRFAVAAPFFYKEVIDNLMVLMDKYTMPGLAKKSICLEAISQIYDYIINPLLPLYLKPFSGWIRALVIDILISNLINFLVSKVRSIVPVPVQPVSPAII